MSTVNRQRTIDDSLTEDMSLTERTENTENLSLRDGFSPTEDSLSPTDFYRQRLKDRWFTDDTDNFHNQFALLLRKKRSTDDTDFTPAECLLPTNDTNIHKCLSPTDDSYIDTVTKNHKVLYELIREYLLDEYGIATDHTSDIPRPCYLPHDDDAFYDEPTFRANPAHPFLADARSTVDSQQSTVYRPLHPADTACRVPTFSDTEGVVREIEKRRIDITGDYLNWIRIAFALASKHGVTGEEYFHRISQFHHGYDPQEAHKVYTSCLRNNSGAVTIGTIVYLIHNA